LHFYNVQKIEVHMLLLDIKDGIAVITIDRPTRRNALDTQVTQRLKDTLTEVSARDDVHAIVLTGSAPGFCAGSDLKELGTFTLTQMRDVELSKGALVSQIARTGLPVIAAVEGFALGGGLVLAAACDFVVSSETASWHLPEVKNGWIPPWGLELLQLRMGFYKARQLVYGPRALSAAEAKEMGVVDQIAPAGQALSAALELAASFTKLSPAVLMTVKRYFADGLDVRVATHDHRAAELFIQNCRQEPARSTLNKFGVK
jgi:enoyl-CoA hydratase/carnithine racemase